MTDYAVIVSDLADAEARAAHDYLRENDRYDVEVRRFLYSGPTRRRGATTYRVLFLIIDPAPDETEGVVRVLHIWHGAQDNPPA